MTLRQLIFGSDLKLHMNRFKCSWRAGNLKRLVRQNFAFVFPKNNGIWTRFAALYRATSGHDLCGKVQQQNHQLHTDGADRQRWISVCADRNLAVFEPLWDLSLETNRSWQTDTVADAFQGLSHPLWLLPLSSLSTSVWCWALLPVRPPRFFRYRLEWCFTISTSSILFFVTYVSNYFPQFSLWNHLAKDVLKLS